MTLTNEDITTGIILDTEDNFTFEIVEVTNTSILCRDESADWDIDISDARHNLKTGLWEYVDTDPSDDFPMSLEYNDDAYDYSGDIDSY